MNKILTVLLLCNSPVLLAQPTVAGNVISWSDDGWYEVQNASDYSSICSGGRSCEVEPGVYKVINHSTGEKFRGIEVDDANPGGPDPEPGNSSVSVTGNVISWPDDGWYQVQDASDYTSICEGGLSCVVEPGVYKVTNHSTGEKFRGVEVLDDGERNRILVSFDITVPAYQSNALRLELEWGDITLTAEWIGDEYWSASGEFLTDTENLLSVTFYDLNGDIELARYTQALRTGSNATSAVQITAGQFDATPFDTDQDGVNNLAELLAGTDPLVDENDNIEDTFHISYSGWSAEAAQYYEPEIKALELPANIQEIEFVDNLPYTSETTVTDIILTTDGNGTYSQTYDFFIALDMPYERSSVGTRSSQDGTVRWSGTEMIDGSSNYYGTIERVFETASTIEGRTLSQQGNGTVTLRRGSWTDTANIVRYNYDFVLDLDSIDEENKCQILYGTSNHSFERHIEREEFSEFTANRNSLEENWFWNNTVDGENTSGDAIETSSRLFCGFVFNQTN